MTLFDKNVARLRALKEQIHGIPAETGRYLDSDPDTVYRDPKVDGNPNRLWVRIGDSRAAVPAWNNGRFIVRDDFAPVAVRVAYNNAGELEIVAGDSQRADYALGETAGTLLSAHLLGEYLQSNINGRAVVPARVRPNAASGLAVVAEPFWYWDTAGEFRYWDGSATLDLTAHDPGGSDLAVYVIVSFDPDASTPALVATAGTSDFVGNLTSADIESIAYPADTLPLAAVRVSSGATALSEGDFIDLRFWLVNGGMVALARGGTGADLSATGPGLLQQASAGAAVTLLRHKLDATTAPTTDDDSGDGYAVGSLWIDVTNDQAYQALDVTVGAAVWKAITSQGTTTFLGLSDTPGDYTGQAGKAVKVNATEDALEFGDTLSSADAADVTYTPADATDWDTSTDPGNTDDALDQLAARVADLEATPPGTPDAADVTYTPADNADWGGSDPGDVSDALDYLAANFGGGGGGTVYTDATSSPPASPANGDIWLPSDGAGLAYFRVSGAWVAVGPLFPMTEPISGDFAWFSQGSASMSTAGGGILLTLPADGSGTVRGLVKSAPATPYTITACFLSRTRHVNYNQFGLVFRNSSSGSLASCFIVNADETIKSRKYTSSAFSADYASFAYGLPMPLIWLRIADNGTSRICSWSHDGQDFEAFHSVGRTDFITANQVGFGGLPFAGNSMAIRLLSWKEA